MVCEPTCPEVSWSLFQKLLGTGMSNIDALAADAEITFPQGDATDLQQKVDSSRTEYC